MLKSLLNYKLFKDGDIRYRCKLIMWKLNLFSRESACLSRKKKKDYVTSLEQRLAITEAELCELRIENASLKARLSTLESNDSTCFNGVSLASNGNTSIRLQNNSSLKWPSLKSATGFLSTSLNAKKNVALLFAMMFMVSLNIGGIGYVYSYLKWIKSMIIMYYFFIL